ncbi:hypothetical protein KAH55_04700 [bacterium]|nr:hypothetical protein [bacterium]
MKKTVFLLMGLFLFTMTANADTYSYPGDDPVFTISFPDNWTIETEDELLHATPPDESIYAGVWAIDNVDDVELILEVLDEEIAKFIQDIEADEPMETEINGIPFIIVDGDGYVEDEILVEFSATLFSTDGETFFIGLYFGTPEMVEEYSEELVGIINSVSIPE